MGIVNREGALYMATGMDVSGVYKGRDEAIGIIRAMAKQITSFDVFSGIGLSAATAFASAAKDAYNFEKEFRKNMLEVATISAQISGSMTENMNKVMAITQQIPISAPEAAKALYQIVSAGHDGANGMKILEVSARAAVGGLTDTATAADAITTILNAYKLSADKASDISDQLFTTVRLGKTDFSQLGASIAQAAPVAAAYGVEIDQVLAAIASLTKQGTPTAQAVTQVRASIIAASKVLGDGAFESRTFQEALAEVAAQANGSESKLRELVPEVEAVNGVLGMTGQNAKAAASDLGELQNSVGATEAAFRTMESEVGNQLKLLANNVHGYLRPMGEAILKNVAAAAQVVNKGFETGKIEDSLETLKKLLVAVAGTFLTYKAAVNMSSTQQAYDSAKTAVLNNLKSIQNKITGESILAKEKERVYQEAYIATLEKTITQEERAKLAKLNLKSGSAEYSKTLSELALQERKNAESLVDSLTKQINKNKEKLVVAQESLNASRQAVEAAKKEFDAAFAANDLAALEVAQTKLNAAAKREEAAANNMTTLSQKVNNQQKQLSVATTNAETTAIRINTATTKADAAVKGVATTATNKLKMASLELWAAMKVNPVGAILTLVSLATTAYMLWGTKIDGVSSKMRRFNLTSKSSLEATQKTIDENANSLEVLMGKYNELKKISSPTSEEQQSLREVIKSIAEIVPSATTAINQYNNALDINIDKANEYVKKQKEILTDLSGKNVTEWMKELHSSSKEIVIAKEELMRGLKFSNFWGFNKEEQLSPSEKEVTKRQIQELEIKRDLIFELLSKTGIAEKELRVELSKLFNPKTLFNPGIEFEGRINVLRRFDEYFAKKNLIQEKRDKKENIQGGQTEEKALTILQRKLTLTKELSEVEDKLKKLRSPESTASQAEIDAAQKTVNELKKKLKDLTGLTESEFDKRLKSQSDLSRLILDSELKLQSARIAIMEDGKDKRVALVMQEYRETLAQIEKERQAYKQKVKEAKGKEDPSVLAGFDDRETTAKGKRDSDIAIIARDTLKSFAERQREMTSIFLTEEEKRVASIKNRYEKEREWAKKAFKTGDIDTEEQYRSYLNLIDAAEQEETTKELLNQYQGYTEKRLSIQKEFQEKRKRLEKSGASQEILSELDYQENEALKGIDEQFASRQEEFVGWCNQIANLSLEQLVSLLENAKEELDSLEKSPGASGEQLASQRAKINKLEEQIKNEKTSTTPEVRSIKQWQKLHSTLSDVKNEFEEIGDSVGGVAGEFIRAAGEITSSTLQMIDGIVTLSNSSSVAVGGVAKAASESIKTVEKASVVLAVISAALQVASKITSLFKRTDYLAEFRKEVEKLNYELELTKLNAEISTDKNSIFGDDLWGGAVKNISLANEALEKYNNTLEEISNRKKYAGLLGMITEANGLKNTYDSLAESLANMQIQIQHSTWFRSAKYSSLKDAVPELFGEDGSVNMDALEKFLGTDTFKKLSAENQQYLQEMADYWKAYQEAVGEVKGHLGGIFGDLGNTMSDALVDAFKNGTDAAKTFTDSVSDMLEKLAQQMIYSVTLAPLIDEAQGKMLDIMKNEDLSDEQKFNNYVSVLDELTTGVLAEQGAYDSLLQKLQDMGAQKGFELFSPDDSSTRQSAPKGIAASITQESADALNGNFNAQLIYSNKTAEGVTSLKEQLSYIYELQLHGWQDVRAIRDLTDKVNRNTQQISEVAERIADLSEDIRSNTSRTAEAVGDIKLKGIYIKR